MQFKGWRLFYLHAPAPVLGLAALIILIAALPASAVTEVTFTRMGTDKIEVQTDTGEKRVYQDNIPAAPGQPMGSGAPKPLYPVLDNRRPQTAGRVLSTPLVPIEEQTEFAPMYGDPSRGTEILQPQPQPSDNPPIAVPAMETERLQAELTKTRAELNRVSRLLHSPVIISLRGDSAQLQWADATQQITIPRDGVIKIQLAPK